MITGGTVPPQQAEATGERSEHSKDLRETTEDQTETSTSRPYSTRNIFRWEALFFGDQSFTTCYEIVNFSMDTTVSIFS